ncbi:MAG: replication initiation protein [Spirochaetia bacterium]|nr:replication initiation protein [Treponema sp.]MCI6364987.1 replication initiation protein [Spirochaetia bacterium]MCI7436899.1 replication initiation protein [Spirochaetia bacterium]
MKKKSLIIKGFEPNILKIPNNFLRASYKCSATTQRMYFYSIFKYISSDKNQNSVSFSFSDFFSDLNLKDGQKTRTLIKESANEILDMKIVLEDNEKQYEVTNVFQSAKCVFTETTFSFKFTEDMKIFLDTLKEIGFSLFEINDLGKLKSFYALRYYLVALSFKGFKGKKGNEKNSWFFEYSVEDLRKLFDIQDNEYTQIGPFRNIVVDLPLKELNERNLGIQIVCTPIKKGRKITGFHFDCIDSTHIAKVNENNYVYIEDSNKNNKNSSAPEEDSQLMALKIISQNPERYAEILKEEKANPNLFGFSPEMQALMRLEEELKNADLTKSEETDNK